MVIATLLLLLLLLLSKVSKAFTLNYCKITITYSYRYVIHTIRLLASTCHRDTDT